MGRGWGGKRVRWIFQPCFISIEHEKQRGTGPWLPANEVDGRFPLTSGSNLECKEFRTTKGDHRRSAEWNPLWPLRSSIEERQRQEDWRLISVHSTQVSTTHYNNLTGLDLVLQDSSDPRAEASLLFSSTCINSDILIWRKIMLYRCMQISLNKETRKGFISIHWKSTRRKPL